MKSISKIYFTISFIISLLLLGSIWFFNQESDRDKLQELRRFTVAHFEQEFNRQKDDLLRFSLELAKRDSLKKVLVQEDQKEAYQLLYDISNEYLIDTGKFGIGTGIKELRLQLITKELEIFAQNWKSDNEGKELKGFRKDLLELMKNQKAKVGIETGRRLTFKATIPLMSDGKYIGYLETIQFIDELVKKLSEEDIELFVLMDRKYTNKDSLMKGFPLLKGYVIANENYDSRLKKKAEIFSWARLEHLGYYEDDGRLFVLKDMLNGKKEVVGKYLMVLRKNKFIAYKDSYQDTSMITRFSDKDIDNYVKEGGRPAGSYHSIEDRELIEDPELIRILPELSEEDKVLVKAPIRKMLESYTKNQLIDVILENTYKEKKRGEIK